MLKGGVAWSVYFPSFELKSWQKLMVKMFFPNFDQKAKKYIRILLASGLDDAFMAH